MKALFDLDIICYKGAFACNDLGYYAQIRACDNILIGILDRLQPTSYELVLTGSGNFRYKIDPNYKAHRGPDTRPNNLYDIKAYFIKYWGAILTSGYEADDYIAMHHDEDSIVISNDKDFKQLPGKMFNPWTETFYEIDNPFYYFFLQTLVGDAADGVNGVTNPEKIHHKNPPNFTEGTASKLLLDKSVEEMKEIVQEQYKLAYKDDWFTKFDTNARLLWLKRSPEDEYYNHI